MRRRRNATLREALECRPFVKWAGGKTQLVERLKFPEEFGTYYEPFLGGGAVFFHLATVIHPESFPAKLSDSNPDLIGAYAAVRDEVEELIASLSSIQSKWKSLDRSKKPEFYYEMRDSAPDPGDKVARASWFIFLNKTAYNGLYRVNRKGVFNVPYGDYPNATLCAPENLRGVSELLNRGGIELRESDFASALDPCVRGDFVYLDPPYFPLRKTGFTDYTKLSFGEKDQRKLAKIFGDLIKRGCKVLLSNSDSELIRGLYGNSKQLNIDRLSAFRMINSVGSKRSGVIELAIRNYS